MDRETIVAAACWANNVIFSMPPPARHHTIIQAADFFQLGPTVAINQGFVTSCGRFVERAEAMNIALMAEQTFVAPPRSHQLFSEDLW